MQKQPQWNIQMKKEKKYMILDVWSEFSLYYLLFWASKGSQIKANVQAIVTEVNVIA